jgi:hypothetical protein
VGAARIVILHEFDNHFFDPSGVANWGNVRFRALVDAYAERYRHMHPQQKRRLIATLVQVWKAHGGRFVYVDEGDLFEERDEAMYRVVRRRLLRPQRED